MGNFCFGHLCSIHFKFIDFFAKPLHNIMYGELEFLSLPIVSTDLGN